MRWGSLWVEMERGSCGQALGEGWGHSLRAGHHHPGAIQEIGHKEKSILGKSIYSRNHDCSSVIIF